MKPFKPLYMKTYGKQGRKVSAWISPENRKQAFDSTTSTDGDISLFEPTKPARPRGRKRSVACHRAPHPAKRKALSEWTIDEDNIPSPPCPQPALQSKTKREKKTGGSSGKAARPAKRKTALTVMDISSDEENVSRPSPPRPEPAQRSKTARKSKVVSVPVALMRQGGGQVPRTSESEGDSKSTAKCHKSLVQMRTDSNVHPPSAGRFVTRRKRAVTAKPKIPKATFSILDSSDDFASGAFGSSKILQPSRRRRVPPTFMVSSAENSLNAAGAAGFAPISFREISLNESADRSLALCPKNPFFCSTPSAGPFSKRPRLKPLSINDQSATPPSMSVSSIGILSTFQEDLNSPGQPFSPPTSAPPVGLHFEEKSQSSLAEQEPSGDLFMEAKSSSEEAKNHSEDIQTKNVGELPSLNLLSTEDSNSSSHFVSAAGGLEWLIEALKEKCLTERCTVQLERLCSLTVTQLCSQTTYSSCLGFSSSVYSWQANEHPPSVDLSQSSEPSFSLNLFATNNKTSGCFESANSSESPEHVSLVTASQRMTDNSPSVDCTNSAELSSSKEPTEQSASVLYVESAHSTDGSIEFVMGTQLPATSFRPVLFTDDDAAALKDEILTKKCKLQLKKLKWPIHQKEADANRSENDRTQDIENSEDLTRSGEIAERTSASVRQPINNSSPVAQTQSDESETEEKAALLTAMLKEKCLTDKVIVAIKRVSLSQLKEILQLRDRKRKVSTDVSASEDQTKKPHQSDSDTNHRNKDTSVIEFNMRKRGSISSEEKTASDKEEAVKNSYNVPHKRKKTSLAPKEKKRRSTSTDRPGTTRKACVSGLSVSRWKNKDAASTHAFRGRTALTGSNKTVDCSINELISTKHKQPRELLGTTMNFSTPVRVSRLNLSSLLADFTPNTHTWSRLKAALSVHRKGLVLRTPGGSSPWVSGSPARTELADVSQDLFATNLRTPLPKHLRSQLLSSSSHVECEDADLSDAEKVYAECGQQRPLPWEECVLPQRMKQCVKIGEGTFGEVFSTTNASGDTVALKIIPLEGSEEVNGEEQKTFGEILHEIIISKELSSLKEKKQNQTRGFIGLNDLHCVQGGYPPDFLNAWDAFDQRKGSENDRPDFFQKDQLFIILEFEFGGIDLENSDGTLTSLGVAKSILHQVTAALAVAEHELHFEHRDLHWGNVLVKTTKQKKGSFLLNGAAHSLETKGVLVRIIDYSLSRLEIDDLTVSCDISKDEALFKGQGDYQFDIYRLMRQENGNNWTEYHPHTNVLWLHYLCSKLLSMKYRGSGGRGAKDTRAELTRFYGNVLQYRSATEALQNCPMFQ